MQASLRALFDCEKLKRSFRPEVLAVMLYPAGRLATYLAMRIGISGGQESNGEGPWGCGGPRFRDRRTFFLSILLNRVVKVGGNTWKSHDDFDHRRRSGGDLQSEQIYSTSILTYPHLFRSFDVLILLEAPSPFKDDLFAVIRIHNVASPNRSSIFLIIAAIPFNTHVAIYSISNEKISKPTSFFKVPVS
jgi:hypothetical protein